METLIHPYSYPGVVVKLRRHYCSRRLEQIVARPTPITWTWSSLRLSLECQFKLGRRRRPARVVDVRHLATGAGRGCDGKPELDVIAHDK